MDNKRSETNNITYSKPKCVSRIIVFLVICLVGSILFFCAHLGDSFLRVDTLVFAIPLCYLFIRYHDVRYCFIAHAVCNLAGIVFPLLIH
jgi:hypothetical protein